MHLHCPLRFATITILLLLLVRLASSQAAPQSSPATAASQAKTSPAAKAAVPPPGGVGDVSPDANINLPLVAKGTMLPAPSPLSDAERIRLRTAQVRALRSQSLRVCATLGELASTPEWQEAQQADAAFRLAIDAIYAARHVDPADAVLCDGPGAGAAANPSCAGVAKDTLEIRAVTRAPQVPAAAPAK